MIRIMNFAPQLDDQNPITKFTDYFLHNWMGNESVSTLYIELYELWNKNCEPPGRLAQRT
jgi:hypothetical protein